MDFWNHSLPVLSGNWNAVKLIGFEGFRPNGLQIRIQRTFLRRLVRLRAELRDLNESHLTGVAELKNTNGDPGRQEMFGKCSTPCFVKSDPINQARKTMLFRLFRI